MVIFIEICNIYRGNRIIALVYKFRNMAIFVGKTANFDRESAIFRCKIVISNEKGFLTDKMAYDFWMDMNFK